MRKLIYGIVAAIAAVGCTSHNGYVLTGHVPEAWAGKPVVLILADTQHPAVIDSTQISGGEFQFKGQFDIPRHCQVVIFLDPENRQDPDLLLAFPVFLDSTAVNATCDNSGKKPIFTLSGGATQTQYDAYTTREAQLRSDRKSAFRAYTDAFYKQKDMEQGIERVTIVNEKNQGIRDFQMQFIRENPASAISLHILRGMCSGYSPLSRQQMNDLWASLAPTLQQSEVGQSLQKAIRERQIVLGEAYPDLELKDPKGKAVKISDLVTPGHYTLVELWASWCSPCLGEIPFIKHAYKKYHSKGFDVISISIDQSEADWKRALDAEKMPWAQLLDDTRKSFDVYETSSVPTSLLIDPQGRICDLDVRGGWLEKALQEIYGK